MQALPGSQDDILLVPLFGHTHGHCGVAVRTMDGYLLHAGDAYFYHGEMDAPRPRCVPGLRLYQRMMEVDRTQRLHNQDRLRAIHREYAHEIRIISAHDTLEFRNARNKEERWAQSA